MDKSRIKRISTVHGTGVGVELVKSILHNVFRFYKEGVLHFENEGLMDKLSHRIYEINLIYSLRYGKEPPLVFDEKISLLESVSTWFYDEFLGCTPGDNSPYLLLYVNQGGMVELTYHVDAWGSTYDHVIMCMAPVEIVSGSQFISRLTSSLNAYRVIRHEQYTKEVMLQKAIRDGDADRNYQPTFGERQQ